MPTDGACKATLTNEPAPLMPEWIVPTKLAAPPARSRLVGRPQLLRDLHAAIVSARLTLVSAPAGFGSEYAHYAAAQWHELIESYMPSILWNDMGWPADCDPRAIFTHYYDTVGDGLVNDRWTQTTLPRSALACALYVRFVRLALRVMAVSVAGRYPNCRLRSATTSRRTSTRRPRRPFRLPGN